MKKARESRSRDNPSSVPLLVIRDRPSKIPYRLAWCIAGCTFLLIAVGGLVTTYTAGMSVPDWPSSFHYWLWLPVEIWFAARSIFLEHFHRLIGILLGNLTIALVVALWWLDRRRWMLGLGLTALAVVCFQGALGGLRVIQNERVLANVHGCTAPLFFGLAAALVMLTSRAWLDPAGPRPHAGARGLHGLTTALVVLIYVQIVVGAQMRHLLPDLSLGWFPAWVWIHLVNAGLISIGLVWLLVAGLRGLRDVAILPRRINLLAVLYLVQLVLGALAWLTKYGWPRWAADRLWASNYTVVTAGPLQGIVISAHVATGALCLVTALSLALWSRRLLS